MKRKSDEKATVLCALAVLLGALLTLALTWLGATVPARAEPVARLIGALAVTLMKPLLPWGMAFAAGAMLYVVSDEIIPETHRRGHELEGTWGVILGFLVMMALDNMFG